MLSISNKKETDALLSSQTDVSTIKTLSCTLNSRSEERYCRILKKLFHCENSTVFVSEIVHERVIHVSSYPLIRARMSVSIEETVSPVKD
jgi:hypothetical protein